MSTEPDGNTPDGGRHAIEFKLENQEYIGRGTVGMGFSSPHLPETADDDLLRMFLTGYIHGQQEGVPGFDPWADLDYAIREVEDIESARRTYGGQRKSEPEPEPESSDSWRFGLFTTMLLMFVGATFLLGAAGEFLLMGEPIHAAAVVVGMLILALSMA